MKKYYFINYAIDIPGQRIYYGRDLVDQTPFQYAMHYTELNGLSKKRIILSSYEIEPSEYRMYKELINDE